MRLVKSPYSSTFHTRLKLTTFCRLILYFPVSALVTLFANILQNPQDPRARSDVKLMNQVVSFLSLLAVTEEQGGVKRMLGVCTEFERIARVVLERGDKESTRRKRRSSKINTENDKTCTTVPPNSQQPPHGQKRAAPETTPQSNNAPTPQNVFTPSNFNNDLNSANSQSFNPSLSGFSPSLSDMNIPLDFSGTTGMDFQNMMAPSSNGDMNGSFNPADTPQFLDNPNTGSPFNTGSFQQPFVPQDLWQMPMTLEWDLSAFEMGGMDGGMDGGMGQGQDQPGQQQQQPQQGQMMGNGVEGGDGIGDDQRGLNGGGRVTM